MLAAGAPSISTNVASDSGTRRIRSLLFFATFFLIWLSLTPFRDLADPQLLDPVASGNALNQISVVLLTASLAAFVLLSDARIVLKAATPLLGLTIAWFALSALLSDYPDLAGRRLLLAVLTLFNAAAFLTLPKDEAHFGRLLAGAALILLAVAYASVLLIPDRAIHRSGDLLGADLIGAWRGPFAHKNGAGAGMVVVIFVGIYLGRSINVLLGALVVATAGLFLVFTVAKAPMALLPLVLLISFVLERTRGPVIKLLLVFAPPIIITIVAVGSVCFAPVHDVVAALLPDATFTDRDQIWRFTLDYVAQRPVFGFGFQAFWQTSEVMFGTASDNWVARTSDAHNGFLNLAVMTGIVGLILSACWILAQTAADYLRSPPDADLSMTTLFIQIWLFGTCLSGFESTLFAGGNSVWFMMLVSMFGLRFQRTALSR